MNVQTVRFSDGTQRQFKLTLGTFERIEDETGIDYLELFTSGQAKTKHFTKIIAASLIGEPKMTSREVADQIDIKDLNAVAESVVAAFTGDSSVAKNGQGTA